MFDQENTCGCTDEEIESLNQEFKERFENGEWPTDDEEIAFNWFSDEVARR
jgi:hypothetical protein